MARSIYIAPNILKMGCVRHLTREICDGSEFRQSAGLPGESDSWTLVWGGPTTKRRFGVAETGFFWKSMHIDTIGLYQYSSLNTAPAQRLIREFCPPESAQSLINRAPIPKSKYRQPKENSSWSGVVFACQNPADRSIKSIASAGEWWRFLEICCRYYGSKLFVKLHPKNRKETKRRIEEMALRYGCEVGRVGHGVLDQCEHVVLFNSTFSVDCMLKGIPVKQGAPGYFYATGAVTYCAGDPSTPLSDSLSRASQLVDFLLWRYCFHMHCPLENWRYLLRHYYDSRDMFPLRMEDSFGAFLQEFTANHHMAQNSVSKSDDEAP